MKVLRLIMLLLVLAGTIISCTDEMDDIVLKDDTDPSDKPGGNGGSGGSGSGSNGGSGSGGNP